MTRGGRQRKTSRWAARQNRDRFVRQARSDGWRARAVFKLEEIQRKYRLLKPGMTVVDLGAAPGSWSQYAAARIGHGERGNTVTVTVTGTVTDTNTNTGTGRDTVTSDDTVTDSNTVTDADGATGNATVTDGNRGGKSRGDKNRACIIAVDKLDMKPIAGVVFIRGDFTDDSVLAQIESALGGRAVDLVLSDLSPDLSGIRSADQARAEALQEAVLAFCARALRRGGGLLMKAFAGESAPAIRARLEAGFDSVRALKPAASRAQSREMYHLARGFTGFDTNRANRAKPPPPPSPE